MHIAIIGSGPAGFYAAEALIKRTDAIVHVDVFDRLPTPYGLVRGGVAPDHQNIKAATRFFERTAAHPSFRFFGNVRLGRDVTVEDLRQHYHQIVYATGNEADRRLGIPGEGVECCTPASVFFGWYNGHPDYREAKIDLTASRVAIVGHGNVAVDAARILLRSPAELEKTDIAAHALEVLRASKVREVFLLGRRGPGQSAFSPRELDELGNMAGVDPIVFSDELEAFAGMATSADAHQKENLKILRDFAAQQPKPDTKKVHIRFLVSPTEVIANGSGKVSGLKLEKNRLFVDADGNVSAHRTGETEMLDVGMVLPAIGFSAERIAGVPFDDKKRVVANRDGRVIDPASGSVIANEYVVGWARSGPQGLIGSHKRASAQVVAHMIADGAGLTARELPDREQLVALLRERGLQLVTFADWKQLDDVEVARGARRGAPREKIVDVAAMLGALTGGNTAV